MPSSGSFLPEDMKERRERNSPAWKSWLLLSTDFAHSRVIFQTSLSLDSGKCVDFIQTFGPLVSFSYYLVLVLSFFGENFRLIGQLVQKLLTTEDCNKKKTKQNKKTHIISLIAVKCFFFMLYFLEFII